MGGTLEPIRLTWLRIHLWQTGGEREGSHSKSHVVLPLGLYHQNLHKYDIVELQLDVCLSETATFKRQGQVEWQGVGRCGKGGADRLKISASHSRQVGGVNSKNSFSLPLSCSRSSFLSFERSHINIGWHQLVMQ